MFYFDIRQKSECLTTYMKGFMASTTMCFTFLKVLGSLVMPIEMKLLQEAHALRRRVVG